MKLLDKLFGTKHHKENPSMPKQQISLVTNPKALEYYQKGQRYYHEGNYVKAVELLRQGIAIEPIFAGYANLGAVLMELEHFAEAAVAFEKAVEINSTDLAVHIKLSQCYMDDNRWDDALTFLTSTLEHHQSVDLYYNLGCVYSAKQMYDDAIAAQRQVLELDPSDADALYNLGTDLLNKYLEEDNPNFLIEAITCLERCVTIDPNQTDAQARLEQLRQMRVSSTKPKVDAMRSKATKIQSIDELKVGEIITLRNGYLECQIENIKRGGMGVVYIARHLRTDTLRAIKTFQGQAAKDRLTLERFAREAEIWIRLEGHTNIVAAEYVEWVGDRLYLLMDYIDGLDLRERMSQKRLTLPKILDFAIQFCSGMDFAYKKQGIIHRDIKPENILVTRNDIIKITDFGLAKAINFESIPDAGTSNQTPSIDHAFTRTGEAAGTLPYMPPEQFANFKNVGITADVYAFGITLYELLVGQLPFSTLSMKKLEHLSQLPPPLRQFDPKIPIEMETLILRCLDKSPERRPADFEELKTELMALFVLITGEKYVGVLDRGGQYRHKDVTGYSNLMDVGKSLQNIKNYEEAIQYYQRAAKLNPTKISPYLTMIECCRKLGWVKQGIEYCDQSLLIEPENSQLWGLKGGFYLEMFDQNRAIECLNRALEIDPQNYSALVNKGVYLGRLGHFEEAMACYAQVPESDTNAAIALNNKATILWTMGQHDEALICLNQSLGINPDNIEAQLNKRNYELKLVELNKSNLQKYKEWINHGLVLFKDEQYQKALDCFIQALEFDGTQAEAWTFKADDLIELGDTQEAIACYKKALDCDADWFDAWFGLGNCYFDHEQFESALRCFERASQLQLGDEQVWISQGSSLANLGRFQDALDCFDKAVAITPYDEVIQAYQVECQKQLGRNTS